MGLAKCIMEIKLRLHENFVNQITAEIVIIVLLRN